MKTIQKTQEAQLRQALQIKIGDLFRLAYADVDSRELPARFLDLLERLDRIEIAEKFHKGN